MKILFVDQSGDLGGAQLSLLQLLPAVRQSGWEAIVAAPAQGELLQESKRAGAQVIRLQHAGPLDQSSFWEFAQMAGRAPRLARQLRRVVEENRVDLVFVNGAGLIPAASMAAWPVGWGRRVPLLFLSHHGIGSWILERAVKWGLRRTNAVVVGDCEHVARPWNTVGMTVGKTAVATERMHVIPVGVPPIPVGDHPDSVDAAINLGVVGRIAPEKGQQHVLEALRILYAEPECPRIRCIIAGVPRPAVTPKSGNDAARQFFHALQDTAVAIGQQFPQQPPVEFLGWVPAQEILPRLDLLAVPVCADSVATPRVIAEAYSAGVPVIAAKTGGIPETVQAGVNGFLVQAGSPEALAEGIRQALLDEERLDAMIARGRQTYQDRHTLDRYHRRLLQVMAEAAGQPQV